MRWTATASFAFGCLLAAGCRGDAQEEGAEEPAARAAVHASGSPKADAPAALVSATPKASAAPERAPDEPVTVSFVGDLNLALEVGIHLEALAKGQEVPEEVGPGYPFTHVAERLVAADFLVGNLECVASPKGTLATDHNPFRCATNTIEVLLEAGFDLVSVANNHALDFGQAGFSDMKARLEAGGLPHFGAETFTRRRQAPFVRKLGGLRVGMLAYYYPPDTMADVKAARPDVDVLIAFMHWGREDQPEPLLYQRRLAGELIDAGVDAVVGTHAHVVQPTGEHDGKFIAYGLGNFVFSGMNHSELHRTGQLLELDLHPDGRIEHRLLTIRLDEVGAPRFVAP